MVCSTLVRAKGGQWWDETAKSTAKSRGSRPTAVVFRAISMLFVAGSGPKMGGRRSCCVKDPSPIGGVAGMVRVDGEQ